MVKGVNFKIGTNGIEFLEYLVNLYNLKIPKTEFVRLAINCLRVNISQMNKYATLPLYVREDRSIFVRTFCDYANFHIESIESSRTLDKILFDKTKIKFLPVTDTGSLEEDLVFLEITSNQTRKQILVDALDIFCKNLYLGNKGYYFTIGDKIKIRSSFIPVVYLEQ